MSQNKNNADWERLMQAQKETERLLREQKLQLDAALNNMLQGLCMFDAEEKIVLFNQRYAEMFKLPALWQRIDALDGRAKGLAQLALYQATQDLVNAQTLWFLRNGSAMSDLPGTIARHRTGVGALKSALASVLPARRQALLETEARRLAGVGVPAER